MDSWMVLLLIFAATVVLGGLVVLLFQPRKVRISLNLAFAAVTLGVVLSGWLAVVLAELNRFSLGTLLVTWLIVAIILAALVWHRWRRLDDDREEQQESENDETEQPKKDSWKWLELAFLLVWLAASGWLFFRPHEAIMGGADAGVYVSLGAEIAQNGGFRITDETLANLDPALQAVTLRPLPTNPIAESYLVPGFYVTDAAAGEITPQFYPLHPIWQAVAFAFSGTLESGIRAELMMTGFWMILGSLAIYLTARELAGRMTAVLVILGLSLMAIQVWFARYPTTEALTQFLLWAGLWAMLNWLGERRSASMWAFVTGTALGSVFLVRIDVLIMLPIFGLLVVALWARGWRKSDWLFVIPFVLLVIHSFIHAVWLSGPYFYEHIGFGLRLLWKNLLIPLGAILLSIVFLVVVYLFRGRFAALSRYRRPLLAVLVGAVLLYAVYGWFIRPVTAEAIMHADTFSEGTIMLTNHENWLRLGWYLAPLGIWLGVLGSCLLLWRVQWKTAPLLAVGCLFTAVYLWNVRANPHQIYVMRRFVPAVAPFFILSAGYLLGDLLKHGRNLRDNFAWPEAGLSAAGLVLSVIWLLGFGWSARGFISQVDHEGLVEKLAAFEAEIPDDAVLLFNDPNPVGRGDFWGTPLKFIYGHDIFTLRDLEGVDDGLLAESIKSWQNNGRQVVWIGDPVWLAENDFQFQEQQWEINSQRLESSYERKPQAVVTDNWQLPMAVIGEG